MIHEQTEEMAAPQRRRGVLLAAKLFFGGALAFFGACVIYTATLPMGPSENVRAALDAPAGIATAPVATRATTARTARKPVVRKTRRAAPVQRRTVRVPKAPVRPKATKAVEPQRFKNCTELRKVHADGVPRGHSAYERKHDRDKDNWACEVSGWNAVPTQKAPPVVVPTTTTVNPPATTRPTTVPTPTEMDE